MEAIKFENVYFSYEDATDETDVFSSAPAFCLDGVNLSVEQGEFVAVLGHNGSGKSTLARLVNGLLQPKGGTISVFGRATSDEKTLFDIKKDVGIVFQNPDNQTVASIVEDDVAFGPENVGVPREQIGERIRFALQAVGMEEYAQATTTRLSGGQKQRIAIAGVLALKPKIMILDESTAMLDPRGRKEVMDVVCRLNKEEGITVLLITHFPEEALLADRTILMNKGKIVAEGTPEQIFLDEERLLSCGLTLPRSIGICRRLSKLGIPVPDVFSAEELAQTLALHLQKGECEERSEQEEKALSPVSGENAGEVYCENLSYVYNDASPFETHALNGVSLQIPSGSFFGVIGCTGSGKSTFVQHLNALFKLPTAEKKYKRKKPKKGEQPPVLPVLKVNGFDLADKTTDFRSLRKRVGMVFQYPEYQLFAETVFEDVAFGLKNFQADIPQEELESAVKDALSTVGLSYEEIKDKSPFELSGGQKRRVAIAGILVTKPEILILDEPAAGLDPLGKRQMMELLKNLQTKWCKTVIVVSHDMDEIAEYCNLAAVFAEGRAVACASPARLFAEEKMAVDAGLDVPFTAKVERALHQKGIPVFSDLTVDGFIQSVYAYYQASGAGTRLPDEGGAK